MIGGPAATTAGQARNFDERIQEAKLNGWLGEVDGLQPSLDAATANLRNLDRISDGPPHGQVLLDLPGRRL